eukprot:scaffold14566_cov139-Skeletonema_marinoi.AAC.1
MASNDDTQDTLSSLPSNQEGRDDQEQEGKEGKPNDAAADAPAKEGSRANDAPVASTVTVTIMAATFSSVAVTTIRAHAISQRHV